MIKVTSGLLPCLLLGSLPCLPACDRRPTAPAAWASQTATASVSMSGGELNQLYAGIPMTSKLATLANLDNVRFSSLASLMHLNEDLPALNLDGTTLSATVDPSVLTRLDARFGTLGEMIRQSGTTATALAGQTDLAELLRTELRQEHSVGGSSLSLTSSPNCDPDNSLSLTGCGAELPVGLGLVSGGFALTVAGIVTATVGQDCCCSKSRVLDVETGQETLEVDNDDSEDPAMRAKAKAIKLKTALTGATMAAVGACTMLTGFIVGGEGLNCPQ